MTVAVAPWQLPHPPDHGRNRLPKHLELPARGAAGVRQRADPQLHLAWEWQWQCESGVIRQRRSSRFEWYTLECVGGSIGRDTAV
jgi:hypothetical protein